MVVYTVMCAILGERKVFEVKIDSDERISALKNKIKPADPIGASDLKLYKINIPVPNYKTLIDSISERTIEFKEEDELVDPFCKLSTFQDGFGFPEGNLHILVEVPAGESFSSRPGRDVAPRAEKGKRSGQPTRAPDPSPSRLSLACGQHPLMASGDVPSPPFLCSSPLTCPHRSPPTILHSSYPCSLAAVSPPPNDSCASLVVQF